MQTILVFCAGLVFGLGLIISGMSDPAKVIGFLDIASGWNPSLLLVMLGAVPVSFIGMSWLEARRSNLFGEVLHLPGKHGVNKQLIIGSVMFGIGWAIAGFCPGPALVALAAGYGKAWLFVAFMLVGMLLHDRVYVHRNRRAV